MLSFTIARRPDFRRLSSQSTFDVAVIGGGITGTGIARDAALRGLSVILIERDDLAAGTSSRSSRLIHGGLRYLEQARLGLVHESVVERWRLMRLAPHLARPLPFLFPVYQGERPSLAVVKMGTVLYSAISYFRTPGSVFGVSPQQAASAEPGLGRTGLVGCAGYYDCSTMDARLTFETALDAVSANAVVLTRAHVSSISTGKDLIELGVQDLLEDRRLTLRARTLAIAAGPWTDAVLPLTDATASRWLRPTKGAHLVFDAARFPLHHAVVMKSAADRRTTFAVPWGRRTYVGTTDTDFPDPSASPAVDAADCRYLLDTANRYFPALKLEPADVVSVWAGVRPLIAPPQSLTGSRAPSDVSREERIEESRGRIVTVAGGKLTTYRAMAEGVVDRLARMLEKMGHEKVPASDTASRPLPGGRGVESLETLTDTLQRSYPRMPGSWLSALVARLGSRAAEVVELAEKDSSLLEPLPGADWIRLAEVVHAVEAECISTVSDFLERRTAIFHLVADQGVSASRVVADVLEKKGITSRQEAISQVEGYRQDAGAWKRLLVHPGGASRP
jgi:glycerol-3-phosphate dehydrogenase